MPFVDDLQFLAIYLIEIECILSTVAHLMDTLSRTTTPAIRSRVHLSQKIKWDGHRGWFLQVKCLTFEIIPKHTNIISRFPPKEALLFYFVLQPLGGCISANTLPSIPMLAVVVRRLLVGSIKLSLPEEIMKVEISQNVFSSFSHLELPFWKFLLLFSKKKKKSFCIDPCVSCVDPKGDRARRCWKFPCPRKEVLCPVGSHTPTGTAVDG